MHNPWVVVTIILGVLLLFCLMGFLITSYGWYKTSQILRKREKRHIKEGTSVSAKVTKVVQVCTAKWVKWPGKLVYSKQAIYFTDELFN